MRPYLIDLMNPDDWLYPITLVGPDGTVGEHQRTIFMPEGADRLFCVTDSVMHANQGDPNEPITFCHEHKIGYEIFFVDSGSMDIIANGLRSRLSPGDILFLQPYVAHSMFFFEDVKYRGFFHHLSNSDAAADLAPLRAFDPDYAKDPEFPGIFKHPDMGFREPEVDFKVVPASENPVVRHKDRPLAAFSYKGITAKMLTGRWENQGSLEMWCFELSKGTEVESNRYLMQRQMYYVTSGEVKFKIFDQEFVAKAENIVNIPSFARFKAEALTDAVVYDVGGLPRWYAYFKDRASIMKLDPERWEKPETKTELQKKYGIEIKSVK